MINDTDEHGYALIHYFAYIDYDEAIKALIDFGADANIKALNGEYPLYIASAKGHERTVKVLMRNGASLLNDVNNEASNGGQASSFNDQPN